jgi:hypothetical protein
MSRDRNERQHRRTVRNPGCQAVMAGADFDAVPSLAEAMGLQPESDMSKRTDWSDEEQVAKHRFKWTIEIEVSGTWVADGFDFDEHGDRLESLLDHLLPFAYAEERVARVVKRPRVEDVRLCQGYPPTAPGGTAQETR